MVRTCNTTCVKCGEKFDRFSGKLLNLSDEFLPVFYKLPSIVEALKTHKHTTLCAKCLCEELGRPLTFSEIKFKSGKWMTSNIAYLLWRANIPEDKRQECLARLRAYDKSGVVPFSKSEYSKVKELFLS